MNFVHVNIEPWSIRFGDHEHVKPSLIETLEQFLSTDWKDAILSTIDRHWWSSRNRAIPSPIVRIDMSPTRETRWSEVRNLIYEVETRPAGLGMLTQAPWNGNREFVLSRLKESFKDCTAFVRTDDSHIHDDFLCAEFLGIPFHDVPRGYDVADLPGPVWVRSATAHHLEHLSLGPIAEDGDKRYMVKLGLALPPTAEHLDFSRPFVIKPQRGTWARDIYVYAPKRVAKAMCLSGTVTQSRILRELDNEDKEYILQPLIMPETREINGTSGYTIWRLEFGWIDSQYRFIGGFWNWRPHSAGLKIHGASDAIFGTVHI